MSQIEQLIDEKNEILDNEYQFNKAESEYLNDQPTPSQPIPDETQKAIEHLQANGYKVTKE